jgi:hypothetical protein
LDVQMRDRVSGPGIGLACWAALLVAVLGGCGVESSGTTLPPPDATTSGGGTAGAGGGIFFMRGLTDPAGDMHLIYTDIEDSTSAHVWGTTSSWQGESADLSNYSIIASPIWNGV